jgi:hypothetical protein
MTSDDTGLPVSGDGEQPQHAVPGQQQDGEPELDANGQLVQGRRARHLDLGVIATLILGVVCAWMTIINYLPHPKRAGGLVALGAVAGGLAVLLSLVVWAEEEENEQPRAVSRIVVIVGGILGGVGFIILTPIWCPDCIGFVTCC